MQIVFPLILDRHKIYEEKERLLTMNLGGRSQFHISTNDVGRSISFYELMGFKELADSKKPFKWVALSDGTLNILLAENEFYGLCFYSEEMEEKAAEIEGQGIEYVKQDMQLGDTWYKVVKDPNDFLVSLISEVPKYFNQVKISEFEPRGKFSEIGIRSDKINESVKFWEKLGFEKKENTINPEKKRVSMNDGTTGIAFYSPGSHEHYFEAPALTFYDKKMYAIIKDLKDAGLKFQEEMRDDNGTIVNAVALSPEGQTFFLFTG
jgi:predicted lactoylglutathione lyase